jgi:hypothetical protein
MAESAPRADLVNFPTYHNDLPARNSLQLVSYFTIYLRTYIKMYLQRMAANSAALLHPTYIFV